MVEKKRKTLESRVRRNSARCVSAPGWASPWTTPRASLGIPAEPVPHADSDRASRPERGSDRSGTTPLNTPPPEEDSAAAPAPSTVSVSMANTVQMTALAPWQVQRRSGGLPDADR
ncbi:unnamed protein product [Gadus morhua 'NCC']